MKDWCIERDHPEVCRGHLANNLKIIKRLVVSMKVLKFSKPSGFATFFLLLIMLKLKYLELP